MLRPACRPTICQACVHPRHLQQKLRYLCKQEQAKDIIGQRSACCSVSMHEPSKHYRHCAEVCTSPRPMVCDSRSVLTSMWPWLTAHSRGVTLPQSFTVVSWPVAGSGSTKVSCGIRPCWLLTAACALRHLCPAQATRLRDSKAAL